jgi:hypothetical protein
MKKFLIFIASTTLVYSVNAQTSKASVSNEVQAMPANERMLERTTTQKVEFPSYYNPNTMLATPLVPKKTQKGAYQDYGWVYSTQFAACVLGAGPVTWGNPA